MADIDIVFQAITPLIEVFDQMGIAYWIGGSLASTTYGISRPTQDADIVADIQLNQITLLVYSLKNEYYIDADMIRDAVRRRASCNLIYLDSMIKIDIFIPKTRLFAQQERQRTQLITIEEAGRAFYLSSPEDIILNKLEWYKMGNEISHRQWQDILGVVNNQKDVLDFAYLRHWATNLDVVTLLMRAYREVGIQEP